MTFFSKPDMSGFDLKAQRYYFCDDENEILKLNIRLCNHFNANTMVILKIRFNKVCKYFIIF